MKNIKALIKTFIGGKLSRRNFMKMAFAGMLLSISRGILPQKAFGKGVISKGRVKKNIRGKYDLVLAEGKDPYVNTIRAIESMGGMGRFVKKGSTVLIKPNIAWDRTPEQAANTDPKVVAALVELAYGAGAKRVNVFDRTCNEPRRCYARSGIQKAAKEKGAHVFYADDWDVVKASFSYKSPMDKWPILREAVECDTFINVPVLKHHRLTGLTLSMKNLMGVCAGNRGLIHLGIGRKLVDLTGFINPDLTVIDAHRVLMKNGPGGGNLDDVVTLNKLIVATDPTLSDAYACKLVGRDPLTVPYIKIAAERNFGSIDLDKAEIFKLET